MPFLEVNNASRYNYFWLRDYLVLVLFTSETFMTIVSNLLKFSSFINSNHRSIDNCVYKFLPITFLVVYLFIITLLYLLLLQKLLGYSLHILHIRAVLLLKFLLARRRRFQLRVFKLFFKLSKFIHKVALFRRRRVKAFKLFLSFIFAWVCFDNRCSLTCRWPVSKTGPIIFSIKHLKHLRLFAFYRHLFDLGLLIV